MSEPPAALNGPTAPRPPRRVRPPASANALHQGAALLPLLPLLYLIGALSGLLRGSPGDGWLPLLQLGLQVTLPPLAPLLLALGLRLAGRGPAERDAPSAARLRRLSAGALGIAALSAAPALGSWVGLLSPLLYAVALGALVERLADVTRPDALPAARLRRWRQAARWSLRIAAAGLALGGAAALLFDPSPLIAAPLGLGMTGALAALYRYEARRLRTWWPGRDALDRWKETALALGWLPLDDPQLPTRPGALLALRFEVDGRALTATARTDRFPATLEIALELPALRRAAPTLYAAARGVAEARSEGATPVRFGDLLLDRLLHVSGAPTELARALLAESYGETLSVLNEHPGSELRGGVLTLRVDADRDHRSIASGVSALLRLADTLEARAAALPSAASTAAQPEREGAGRPQAPSGDSWDGRDVRERAARVTRRAPAEER